MKTKRVKPEYIEFTTKDGLCLPGLLYEKEKNTAVAIYLHGNGSSSVFYDESNKLPLVQELQKKHISVLYFNNRGAHMIKRLTLSKKGKSERKNFGMVHEKIKECIQDIDGAIAFLKKKGYKTFYLIGASTGANKICVYNYYKPKNNIAKYILLYGGDDTGIYYQALGKKKFWKILKESKKKIREKKGDIIIKELLPDALFSYAGFWDIANPDGDYNIFPFYEGFKKEKLSKKKLFRHFSSLLKPTFVVYGSEDEYTSGNVYDAVALLRVQRPDLTYKIVKGADHGFNGKKRRLAKLIADWI